MVLRTERQKTSIVAKQSVGTFVVPDPDDSELRAERGLAGNRVQGPPPIGKLEAEKVRQPAKRTRDLVPPDPIAEERFPAKSDRELSEFLPLRLPSGPEFVLVDQDLGLGHRSISFR